MYKRQDYLQLDKPLPKPTYPTEHEGLLVAISVDVNTERGLLTTRMAAIELGVSDARVRQMVCSDVYKRQRFVADEVLGAATQLKPDLLTVSNVRSEALGAVQGARLAPGATSRAAGEEGAGAGAGLSLIHI